MTIIYILFLGFVIPSIFFIGLAIFIVNKYKYKTIPENQIDNETNLLDVSLPKGMHGYYLIAQITTSKTVHHNASSFGFYNNHVSARTYTPAFNSTKTSIIEITAKTFRELFDQLNQYPEMDIEWVKKRDTDKKDGAYFKYVYYYGSDFKDLNQRFIYLLKMYLAEKDNERKNKINDIRNKFY